MLKKIAIRNYRTFKAFELEFAPDLNIVVGDNDAGKSTLLEAIGIALTLRLGGRNLQVSSHRSCSTPKRPRSTSPALKPGNAPDPPEILSTCSSIRPQRRPSSRAPTTRRDRRPRRPSTHRAEPGLPQRVRRVRQGPFAGSARPTEYYTVQWLGFSGNAITFRSIPAVASLIDATTIRLASGADYHLQGIINNHLTDGERVELARAYRSLREDSPATRRSRPSTKLLKGPRRR